MAKTKNEEALAGALGGMLKRPDAAPTPAPKAPPRKRAPEAEGEHKRTSTGYVRADGTRVFRTSVMLTKAERRWLKNEAEDAGLSTSDYVRRALGLDID